MPFLRLEFLGPSAERRAWGEALSFHQMLKTKLPSRATCCPAVEISPLTRVHLQQAEIWVFLRAAAGQLRCISQDLCFLPKTPPAVQGPKELPISVP